MNAGKIIAVSALAVAASLAGCKTGEESCVAAPAGGNHPGKVAVNTVCPVQPADAADETVTVDYKGKKIAFCCAGCVKKFNAMDEKGKDAILVKATTYVK